MSELANITSQLPAVPSNDPLFDVLNPSASYLPRIQLFSFKTKYVAKGLIAANHYGLVPKKDTIEPLGDKITVFPVCYRYKAIDFSELSKSIVKQSTDPEADEFKRIVTACQSWVKVEGQLNPYSYGAEFMFILPGEIFATIHLTSKSWQALGKRIKKAAEDRSFITFGSEFTERGAYSWQSPTLLAATGIFDLPPADVINAQIAKFSEKISFVSELDLAGLEDGER